MGQYYSHYPDDIKAKVAAHASQFGNRAAADVFHVSESAARCWRIEHGLKGRRRGAPLGNLNALGGRVLNPSRA